MAIGARRASVSFVVASGLLAGLLTPIADAVAPSSAGATPPSYSSEVLADSPALYLRLNEGSGSVANDSSGNSRHQTYASGVTLGAPGALMGDSDFAITRPAGGTYAVTGSAAGLPSGGAPRTFEVWFRTTDAGTYPWFIGYGGFGAQGEGTSLVAQGGGSGNHFGVGPVYPYRDGNWHLLDLTWDGSRAVVYLDGASLGAGPLSVNTSPTGSVEIGGFTGGLDEAVVYPSALTADRVAAHWTRGSSSAEQCAATPASPYASAVLADSPAVYYRLGDRSSDPTGRVLFDAANCRNGALVPGVSAATAGALQGDSDGAIVTVAGPAAVASVASLPSGSAPRTLEAWIRTTDTQTWPGFIFQGGFGIMAEGNYLTAHTGQTGGFFGVDPSYSFRDGGWHLVDLSWDGSQATLYLDGVNLGKQALPVFTSTTDNLRIGGFAGDVDDAAVYPTALSPAQVSAHWTRAGSGVACAPTPTSRYSQVVLADQPVAYYRLGDLGAEPGSRVAHDASGSCRNGAIRPGATSASTGGPSGDGDAALSTTSIVATAAGTALPAGSAPRTFETWIRTTDTQTWLGFMFQGSFGIMSEGSNLIGYAGAGNSFGATPPSSFRDGSWHLLDLTFDGTIGRLYFDGGLIAQGSLGVDTNAMNTWLRMGGFQGSVDEPAVYPRALTAAQVYSHWFASGRVPPPSLTAADRNGGGSPSERCLTRCVVKDAVNVGLPVDVATGNFWHTFGDLAVPGRGETLKLARTYNSAPGAVVPSGPLGYGWTYNYGLSLSIGEASVSVNEEPGTQVTFAGSGAGPFTPPSRVIATLVHNADGTWTFTRRKRQVFTFDAVGRLTGAKDLNGNGVTLAYLNASTTVVTDQAGRTLTLASTNGLLTSATASGSPSRTVSYGYTAGDLTSVSDLNGGTTRFAYDGNHRLVAWASPRHSASFTGSLPLLTDCDGPAPADVVTNHYDATGRVDCQADANGDITRFDYSSVADSAKVTDPSGNVTVTQLAGGLPVQRTVGWGTSQASTTTFTYEPLTLSVARIVDGEAHGTSFTYDTSGNRLTATDPLGGQSSWTYNGRDQVVTETDPSGVTTTFGYDEPGHGDNGVGNLTSVSRPLLNAAGATVATVTTSYAYDPAHNGDVMSVTDPTDNTTTMARDPGTGYVVSITSPSVTDQSNGTPVTNTAVTCYDLDTGFVMRTITPRGVAAGETCTTVAPQYSTRFTYDPDGAVRSITDPLGGVSYRTYDPDRNLATSTDTEGNEASYTYDRVGRQTEVRRPDGSILKSDYWPGGALERQTDASANQTNYAYDSAGRLESETDPLGNVRTYFYDRAGSLIARQDPSGDCAASPEQGCTRYSYDSARRLTAIVYSDGVTPNVSNVIYDANSRRTAMTDGTGTSTWSWDSLGRLTDSTNGVGAAVSYGYDLNGHVTSIAYPGSAGTVTRHFDAVGRMDSVTDWLGETTTFDYDNDSNLNAISYANQTTGSFTFDAADRLMGIDHAPTASPTAPFASFDYTRDGAGRLATVDASGVPLDDHSYGYTALSQLRDVDTTSYGFDAADNLVRLTTGVTQSFDAANRLLDAGAPISFVGANSNSTPAGATLSVDMPAGVRAGDLVLLAAVLPADKAVSSPPSGYTEVINVAPGTGDGTRVVVWRRTATGGGGSATVGFNNNGLYATVLLVAAYRNVDPTDPLEPVTSGTESGYSVTAPSITATQPGEQLVMVEGTTGATVVSGGSSSSSEGPSASAQAAPGLPNWTQPTGMTERREENVAQTVAAIGDQSLTPAGASGERTASISVTPGSLVGVLLALKPARTTYRYDTRGNRIAVTPPGAPTTTLTYDQANRLTAYGDAAAYTYNGDGLRMSKTESDSQRQFTWNVAEDLPLLLSEGTTHYVYGPGGQVIKQINLQPEISLVGTAKTSSTTDTAITLALPGGITTNDQILVAAIAPNERTVTGPAGYTLVATAQNPGTSGGTRTTVWRRNATAGQANPVVTFPTGIYAKAVIGAVYRGVDPDNPIDDVDSGFASGTTVTAPAVNAAVAGDRLVMLAGATGATLPGSWAAPPGMTELTEQSDINVAAAIDEQALTAVGSTGNRTATFSTSRPLVGVLVTLRRMRTPVLYYHHDQLGSVRALTDHNASTVATYTYDAYGRTTASTGSAANPFGYAGQYTDAETGLQYLRARYYDPVTGQFLTRDPAEALTRSAYGYVNNNPINGTDPSGLFCVGDLCTDGITDAIGDAAGAVGDYASDHKALIATGVAVLGYAACPVTSGIGCAVGNVASGVAFGVTANHALDTCGSSGWASADCAMGGVDSALALVSWRAPTRFLPAGAHYLGGPWYSTRFWNLSFTGGTSFLSLAMHTLEDFFDSRREDC